MHLFYRRHAGNAQIFRVSNLIFVFGAISFLFSRHICATFPLKNSSTREYRFQMFLLSETNWERMLKVINKLLEKFWRRYRDRIIIDVGDEYK